MASSTRERVYPVSLCASAWFAHFRGHQSQDCTVEDNTSLWLLPALNAAVGFEILKAVQAAGLCPRKHGGHLLARDREPNPSQYNFTMMSRTDGQVHATRNLVTISANSLEPVDVEETGHVPALVDRLNAVLPEDIRIISAVKSSGSVPTRTDMDRRLYELHIPLAVLLPDAAAAAHSQLRRLSSLPADVVVTDASSSMDATETGDIYDAPGKQLGRFAAVPESYLQADECAALSRFREALAAFHGWHDFHNFTDKRSRSEGVRWRHHALPGAEGEWLRFPPSYHLRGGPGSSVALEDPHGERPGGQRRRGGPSFDMRSRLRKRPRRLAAPPPVRDVAGMLENPHENWKDWPEEAWSGGIRAWGTDKGMRRCVTRCSADDPVVFVAAGAVTAEALLDRPALQAAVEGALAADEASGRGGRLGAEFGTMRLKDLVIPDVRTFGSADCAAPLPRDVSLPMVRVRVEGTSFVLHQIRNMVGLAAAVARGEAVPDAGPGFPPSASRGLPPDPGASPFSAASPAKLVSAFLQLPRAPVPPLAPPSTLILRGMELSSAAPAVVAPQLPLHPWPPAPQRRGQRDEQASGPLDADMERVLRLASVARGEASATDPLSALLALAPPKAIFLGPEAGRAEARFFTAHLQPRIAGMGNSLLLLHRYRALLEAQRHRMRVLTLFSRAADADPGMRARAVRDAAVAARGVGGAGLPGHPADAGRLALAGDAATVSLAAQLGSDCDGGIADSSTESDAEAGITLSRPALRAARNKAAVTFGVDSDVGELTVADVASLILPPSLGGRGPEGDALDAFQELIASRPDLKQPALPPPGVRDGLFARALEALRLTPVSLPATVHKPRDAPHDELPTAAADMTPLVPRERLLSPLEAALCLANGVPSLSELSNAAKTRLAFPAWALALDPPPPEDVARLLRNHAAFAAASAPRHVEIALQRWEAQVQAACRLFGPLPVEQMLRSRKPLRTGLSPQDRARLLRARVDDSPSPAEPWSLQDSSDASPGLGVGGARLLVAPAARGDPRWGFARAEVGHSPAQVLRAPTVLTTCAPPRASGAEPAAGAAAARATPAIGEVTAALPRQLSLALKMTLDLTPQEARLVVAAAGMRVAARAWPLLAPTAAYVRLVQAEPLRELLREGLAAAVGEAVARGRLAAGGGLASVLDGERDPADSGRLEAATQTLSVLDDGAWGCGGEGDGRAELQAHLDACQQAHEDGGASEHETRR